MQRSRGPMRTPAGLVPGVVALGFALGLGACAGALPASPTRDSGARRQVTTTATATPSVTGTAWPCVGLTTPAQAARMAVRVLLRRESVVVATEVVPGGTVYRVTAPPGRYVISSNAPNVIPVSLTLRSGQVAHVDLDPRCK
jgi:hypothetical protein